MKKLSILLASVLTVTTLLVGCGSKEASTNTKEEPKTLTISTWGFNEDLLKKNVYEPFEKKYNVKIVLEKGNNGERLTKLKQKKEGIDLIYLADLYSMQGIKQGLFEKINTENIPNLNNVYDLAKAPQGEGYGPAYTINSLGIVYDPEVIKTPITSWADLWKPELKGKIAIPDITVTAGPLMMMVAGDQAGVDIKGNEAKAFDKMKQLAPSVVKYYGKSSELANMFNQGEIAVAVIQDFAYGNILKACPQAKFVTPAEGSYVGLNTINVVKGSKNKELAEKFIDFALSEEVQTATGKAKVEAPANKNVKLTEEEAKGQTYGEEMIKKLKSVNWEYVNEVNKQWIDTWNKEISSGK
ncbi:putative spermidine/putrescine transport system substrate-binding protein [Clostridium pascui]|uniref:ABC transporter substrate-binding protein n=1 Tax=Clostridium pascui TaxID=46609 RepID=UPI00195A7874|nr:ABC transporter substrate-binding protein [Clostridium pascui]MBM7871186.1 putative spermidine/putrescine transport system substrate-binding protein [Clostridium pascui]